jgi:hypothetical protein
MTCFDWMQGEVSYYVEALRGGYRTPFSAPVTETDKLDYWRRQMFMSKPDGTIEYDKPNAEGRDKLLKGHGIQTYAEVYDAVKPKKGLRPPMPTAEEVFEGSEDTQVQDAGPPDEQELI